jgi:hypothetical protein
LSLCGGWAQTTIHILGQTDDDQADFLAFDYFANLGKQLRIRLQRPVGMSEGLKLIGNSDTDSLVSIVNAEQAHIY